MNLDRYDEDESWERVCLDYKRPFSRRVLTSRNGTGTPKRSSPSSTSIISAASNLQRRSSDDDLDACIIRLDHNFTDSVGLLVRAFKFSFRECRTARQETGPEHI